MSVTSSAPSCGAATALPHGGPTSDPAWLATAAEVSGARPHLIEVDGARAPLTLRRGRLELIGAWLYEPMDLEWRDEEALDELAAAVAATRRPLWLLRVPSASPAIPALRRHMSFTVERDAGSCPVLPLDGDPERILSSRRRHDLRRARRRAAAYGPVEADVHEPSPSDADALLDQAFSIEARSWKHRNGTALALDAQRASFYRRYARVAAAAGNLRLAFLSIGGSPAAMQLAVERDHALWLLKIGYDERFASCSPGSLLLEHTLRWCSERGLERCEFLGKAAPWTRLWTNEEWPCSSLYGYPANHLGLTAAASDCIRLLRTRMRP